MHSWWKKKTISRSISWVLVAALLSMLLLPAHYHLHHLDSADSAGHAHAIDLHLLSDPQSLSHHDEGTSIFAASPDVIVKKDSQEYSPYLLPLVLLSILVIALYRVSTRSTRDDPGPKQYYPFFSPPLRAPPQY